MQRKMLKLINYYVQAFPLISLPHLIMQFISGHRDYVTLYGNIYKKQITPFIYDINDSYLEYLS